MTSPHLTKPRASALVDDLLIGFGSKRIDSKLQKTQDKPDVEDASKAVWISNSWKTVKKVSADSFARYGIELGVCDENSRKQFIAVTKHALETSGRKSEKLDEISEIVKLGMKPEKKTLDDEEEADSKDRLLSLQRSLLEAYSTPSFQKELHELSRLHGAPQKSTLEFKSAFSRLVRSAQLPVISRFGFEASEKGVENMLQAFRNFGDDADIYVNAAAIKETLLFSPTQTNAEQQEQNESPALLVSPKQQDWYLRRASKPESVDYLWKARSKYDVLDLLEDLLLGYSTAEFQQRLKDLISLYSGGKHEAGGYYALPGRAELALEVQQRILPLWGFSPTSKGVQDMVLHCAKYLHEPGVALLCDLQGMSRSRDPDLKRCIVVNYKGDSQVADMFDAINSKLGMSAAACERFRKLASSLATH